MGYNFCDHVTLYGKSKKMRSPISSLYISQRGSLSWVALTLSGGPVIKGPPHFLKSENLNSWDSMSAAAFGEAGCGEFCGCKESNSADNPRRLSRGSFLCWALRWECSLPDILISALCSPEDRAPWSHAWSPDAQKLSDNKWLLF